MTKVKSIEDLDRIRKEVKDMIDLRVDNEGKTRIVVGLGTCGIAAGARQVMLAILDEIKKRNVKNVVVSETGCIGLCKYEPLVDVIKPGQPKVTYVNVNEKKARDIVVKHIINNQIIQDMVIPEV